MRLSAVHKPFVTPHIFTTSDLAILKTTMCFKGNFCVKSSNSVPVVYMYAKFLCFVSEVGFLMKSVNFLPSSKNCFNQFCNLYLYLYRFYPNELLRPFITSNTRRFKLILFCPNNFAGICVY